MHGLKIPGAVAVVTGASSGIGRAAALEFARKGADVGLISRSGASLHATEEECKQLGARALAFPIDVRDENAVKDTANRVMEAFGKLDVWVNNAAVSAYGRLEEMPPEIIRRVIETNIFGVINGARAVIPLFREQGRGVLINVSSTVGMTGEKYAAPYAATKAAIRNLSATLRMELLDAPGIYVCTVLPSSVDTPFFHHAANFSGRAIKPISPVYSAGLVARAILDLARHPRAELTVGDAARKFMRMYRMAPETAERLLSAMTEKDHFRNCPADLSDGNLFDPMEEWNTVSGGWGHGGDRMQEMKKGLGAVAAVSGLGFLVWRLMHR